MKIIYYYIPSFTKGKAYSLVPGEVKCELNVKLGIGIMEYKKGENQILKACKSSPKSQNRNPGSVFYVTSSKF